MTVTNIPERPNEDIEAKPYVVHVQTLAAAIYDNDWHYFATHEEASALQQRVKEEGGCSQQYYQRYILIQQPVAWIDGRK